MLNCLVLSLLSCCFLNCLVVLFPLCSLLAIFEDVLFFFVLICGGEVRSLSEVGGLVPLRFWWTPHKALHSSALCGELLVGQEALHYPSGSLPVHLKT